MRCSEGASEHVFGRAHFFFGRHCFFFGRRCFIFGRGGQFFFGLLDVFAEKKIGRRLPLSLSLFPLPRSPLPAGARSPMRARTRSPAPPGTQSSTPAGMPAVAQLRIPASTESLTPAATHSPMPTEVRAPKPAENHSHQSGRGADHQRRRGLVKWLSKGSPTSSHCNTLCSAVGPSSQDSGGSVIERRRISVLRYAGRSHARARAFSIFERRAYALKFRM